MGLLKRRACIVKTTEGTAKAKKRQSLTSDQDLGVGRWALGFFVVQGWRD